jgi:hypothetical protein
MQIELAFLIIIDVEMLKDRMKNKRKRPRKPQIHLHPIVFCHNPRNIVEINPVITSSSLLPGSGSRGKSAKGKQNLLFLICISVAVHISVIFPQDGAEVNALPTS